MHHDSDSEQAKDQLQSSILGNWREGVVAMGGGLRALVAW